MGQQPVSRAGGEPCMNSRNWRKRILLESLSRQLRQSFERGLSYDETMETFVNAPLPVEFARPAVLSGYCHHPDKIMLTFM